MRGPFFLAGDDGFSVQLAGDALEGPGSRGRGKKEKKRCARLSFLLPLRLFVRAYLLSLMTFGTASCCRRRAKIFQSNFKVLQHCSCCDGPGCVTESNLFRNDLDPQVPATREISSIGTATLNPLD